MMAINGMFFLHCTRFFRNTLPVCSTNAWEGLLLAIGIHGLRDRRGGLSFTPRALFFFLLGPGLWAVAQASPSSVCLGCRSVSFFCIPLPFYSVCFSCVMLLGALSLSLCRRCAFCFIALVALPLAAAYVIGGVLCAGGYVWLRCLCLLFC